MSSYTGCTPLVSEPRFVKSLDLFFSCQPRAMSVSDRSSPSPQLNLNAKAVETILKRYLLNRLRMLPIYFGLNKEELKERRKQL